MNRIFEKDHKSEKIEKLNFQRSCVREGRCIAYENEKFFDCILKGLAILGNFPLSLFFSISKEFILVFLKFVFCDLRSISNTTV